MISALSGEGVDKPTASEPNSALERPQGITSFVDAEDTVQDLTIATETYSQRLLKVPPGDSGRIRDIAGRPTFMTNVNWTTS